MIYDILFHIVIHFFTIQFSLHRDQSSDLSQRLERSFVCRCPPGCFDHQHLGTSKNCPVWRRRKVSRLQLSSPVCECVAVLNAVPLSWGRILSSTGSTPFSTPLDPTLVSVAFIPSPTSSNPTPLVVLESGEPVGVDEARASEILGEEEFEIKVDLGGQGVGGKEAARYWTCDFSYVSALAF